MDKAPRKSLNSKRGLVRGPEANTNLRFISVWTNGMDGEVKDKFDESLRIAVAGPVFERLRELIKERVDQINRRQHGEQLFETANWPYLQAHMLGRKSELQAILELISPKERT